MFWTVNLEQINIFGDRESTASDVIVELYRQALACFGEDEEQDRYRQYIFLTHKATQDFLKPLLLSRYGTVDAAKVPTIEWLEAVGSFETIARTVRDGSDNYGATSPAEHRKVPDWYCRYLSTARWKDVRRRALYLWQESHFMQGDVRCSFNHRHEFSDWHHADYARIGCGDEFRTLVPLCRKCHDSNRKFGPAIPQQIPETVKKWINADRGGC